MPRLSSNTGPPATQIGRFARSAGDLTPEDRDQKSLAVVEGHGSEEQSERLLAPELPGQPARDDVDVRLEESSVTWATRTNRTRSGAPKIAVATARQISTSRPR